MRVFVRPNFRAKHYGELEPLAAIEPPAHMLQMSWSDMFVDQEIGMEIPNGTSEIILCPHGNHPSAIFQNIKDCETVIDSRIKGVLSEHKNINLPIPYSKIDVQKYRPHNWHRMSDKFSSWGYGVSYLSTSCKYGCKFCFVKQHYGKYWERDVSCAVSEIDYLYKKGVYNIKMLDEVFLSDTPRVNAFLDEIRLFGDRLNIWGYARIDGITEAIVKKARKSGVKWLAVGIESSQIGVRMNLGKGNFTNLDIMDAIEICEDNGINVIANYIVGLPGDDPDRTKEFAMDLNTAFMNVYSYVDYVNNISDPKLGDVRKSFFNDYFNNPAYMAKVSSLFGEHRGTQTIKTMMGDL